MKTLLLIDGNALVHRAYHALPNFRTSKGIPTNALYGFASMLHKVVKDFSPSHVFVCFDAPGKTFRDKLFKEYRSHRPEADKDLVSQFPLIKDFLSCAHIPFEEQSGLEADDLIAVMAKQAKKKDLHTIILTGDKDIFQLIDSKTYVLTPQLGATNGKLYNESEVKKRFGISPHQIPDHKALAGDPSDNYKGVPGIGPKTATSLINTYGSIEDIYKKINKVVPESVKKKLIEGKNQALLAKKLAVLAQNERLQTKIADTKFTGYNKALEEFFDKYEFKSLKKRYFNNKTGLKPKKPHKDTTQNQLGLF